MNTLEITPTPRVDEKFAKIHSIPYLAMQVSPFLAIFTEIHWVRDLLVFAIFYLSHVFFITAGYHRYFSHRSYKMGRIMQFIMALGGTLCVQKGVLWWAANHRHHHKYSDMPEDIHSPKRGFWWSHVGWILCPRFEKTRADLIPDLTKYPELCWLNRHYLIPPILMGALVYFFVGPSALFIGYLGAVVVTGHVSFTINSFAHVYGRRRYVTSDTSRNNFFLALLTFGEGWHNNHHHYPLGTSQGHFWWEVDLSYYFLKLLETVGLVEDVRRPPRKVLTKRLIRDGHSDIGMFQTYMDKAMVSLSRAIQATGAMCEEKRHALDILLQNTMKAAEEIAQMPVASRPPAEL